MTRMQINLKDNIKYLVGSEEILRSAPRTPVLETFSDRAIEFLASLSREILALPYIRAHVDVMSYAYWIRRASLEKSKEELKQKEYRLGRGVAFHIAPSNVPVNFAVSMTSSFLAGNISVIRVSNKDFEEVKIICGAMNTLLEKEENADMRPYFCIVRYDHSDEISAFLSSICDVRIIWGGDRTIEQIRKYPLPPRAIEMCFSDRHSIAIIDSEKYLKADPDEVAKKFYTDTYYSDQNACSSPRLIVWLGDSTEAKERFWQALYREVKARYEIQPIQVINKFSILTEIAMKLPGSRVFHLEEDGQNNKLVVVDIPTLSLPDDETVMDYKMNSGYFYQYTVNSLDEIEPILNKSCQTLAVLGRDKEEVTEKVVRKGVRGVDRVVNIGDTMGLEFVWDGYRMIDTMSRVIYIYSQL